VIIFYKFMRIVEPAALTNIKTGCGTPYTGRSGARSVGHILPQGRI
jgi:hypothetical protein